MSEAKERAGASDEQAPFRPSTVPPAVDSSLALEGGVRPRTLVATEGLTKYFPVRAGCSLVEGASCARSMGSLFA